jgi:hypothetical protein
MVNFNPLHFTDKNGNILQLGDKVKATGKFKNYELTFVFCIPQHRFGFIANYEQFHLHERIIQPFVIDTPNLHFYYTPSNIKLTSKI